MDYLIILGAGLNGDKLSWTLWERVDKGLRILQDNKDMRVVVSGGKGPGEWITEAEAMQRYLVEQGIAKERIIKEEQSTSTMENFRFTRELLEAMKVQGLRDKGKRKSISVEWCRIEGIKIGQSLKRVRFYYDIPRLLEELDSSLSAHYKVFYASLSRDLI